MWARAIRPRKSLLASASGSARTAVLRHRRDADLAKHLARSGYPVNTAIVPVRARSFETKVARMMQRDWVPYLAS
jgi:hypothetical protein